MTSTNHAARTIMSRRPDKRVVAGWELTAPLLSVRCVPDPFMYLSLILTVILLLATSATAAAEQQEERDMPFCISVLQQYYHRSVARMLRKALRGIPGD